MADKIVITKEGSEIVKMTASEIQAENKQKSDDSAILLKTAYLREIKKERGSVQSQLEYIVENGIDAFIARDMAIRARNPKLN